MVEEFQHECKTHGLTLFVREKWNPKQIRCRKCRTDGVKKRRRKVKRMLVEALGGKCSRCPYDKSLAALDFHHVGPKTKSFGIAHKGITASYARLLEEAKKCVLLCANCHREIEEEISNSSVE
jgi:5-methylcytosine-specific restriction endonuclease McrA